ncbi:MFS transporter [Bacillus cereus]|uniref:MFS transporter n=1 Tax=Bacillus sp. AFS023182 TaxID=2033492 RepID=UPI000BF2EB07|nr:MFS transporter [Bacillus sp. AFS023182]PFD95653.1 MFS transporter [Bacillus sp. AFS023182]PGX91107.1 MFS transporter [Bacillus cereus]
MSKILLLTFGMFALGVDAYIMAGILPQIADDFHVSIGTAGQTVSIFTICYAIAAPLFATFMRKANTKHTLLAALFLFTLSNFITAVTHQFIVLLISRGIAGIGAGIYAPLASAAAVTFVSEKQKGRALSTILLGMSAGTVIGVPFGIYIASAYDWRMAMWFIVTVGVIGIFALFAKFPMIESSPLPTLKERLSMFKNKKTSLVMLITMILSFCSLGLYTYLDTIVVSYGFQKSILFIWMWGIGGIAGSFVIGLIIDLYKKPKIVLMYLMCIMFFSLIFMSLFHGSAVLLALCLILWGGTGWATLATQQKILLEISPEHATISIALLSSINYFAGSIGTMASGVFLEKGVDPINLPYILGGILLLAIGGQILFIGKEIVK